MVENTKKINTEKVKVAEKTITLVYLGPTLPAGKLKSNPVFNGTEKGIKTHMSAVLEEYPEVEKLLVPVSQLAEYKDKIKNAGNVINKYYNDILNKMSQRMEG